MPPPATRSKYLTAIEAAKKDDTLHSLILIMGDLDAKKVLVAWTLYGARCQDRRLKEDTPEHKKFILDLVWDSVDVDLERLSILAGLPYTTTSTIYQRLKEARIIFPDGTATENAMVIIKSDVGAYLKALGKGK